MQRLVLHSPHSRDVVHFSPNTWPTKVILLPECSLLHTRHPHSRVRSRHGKKTPAQATRSVVIPVHGRKELSRHTMERLPLPIHRGDGKPSANLDHPKRKQQPATPTATTGRDICRVSRRHNRKTKKANIILQSCSSNPPIHIQYPCRDSELSRSYQDTTPNTQVPQCGRIRNGGLRRKFNLFCFHHGRSPTQRLCKRNLSLGTPRR
jgi:hypothetical protein